MDAKLKALLEKLDLSFDKIREKLAVAAGNAWIRDVYDSWFVYENNNADTMGVGDGKTYRRSYVIDQSTSVVTLGDPVEVIAQMTYYAVGQESADLEISGELIPLIEKAVRKDGTMAIKIIQPGWGSSGFYPADVLERDGPKVFTKGLHSYWNHPSASEERDRPERDLRDLAGVLTKDAYWDANGSAGPGLYGEAQVMEQYRSAVSELAPHIGMSIRAYGKAREGEVDGRKGNIISELASARSVDVVTAAGAGGKILELFESAGRIPAKGADQVTEEEAKVLREANEALKAQVIQKDETIATKEALIASLKEAVLMRQAQEVATSALAEIEMPAPTRQRILTAQAAIPVRGEDGNLNESAYREQVKTAAQAEIAYINEVRGSGKIMGMGAGATNNEGVHAALVEAFKRMGLSAESAEVAANGRMRI
jgi:hypothetical protein